MDTLYNNSKAGNQPKNKHLKNTGDIFISNHHHSRKPARTAGDIQAKIDLRAIVRLHVGQPMYSSQTADTHVFPFDPDGSEIHVFYSYYRNPDTGDRGGAIKFIQRARRCSYDQAIAYLEGWHDSQAAVKPIVIPVQHPADKHPVQLSLFALLNERVCP